MQRSLHLYRKAKSVGISHHLEYITQKSQDRSVWCLTPAHLTKEVSLNDVLLTGPDLNNTLLGVLMRFRKEPVAITVETAYSDHVGPESI